MLSGERDRHLDVLHVGAVGFDDESRGLRSARTSEVGLQLQCSTGAEVEPTGPVAPCPLSASAAFGRIPALAVLEVHRRLWVGRPQVRANQSDRGSVNRTEVVVKRGGKEAEVGRPPSLRYEP